MLEDPEPRLPVELEREIFDLASWNDLVTGSRLIQVAKRVHEWIEPSLYRVFILTAGFVTPPSPFLPRFKELEAKGHSAELKRRAKFVRHLICPGDILPPNMDLLVPCTNIVDLAFWVPRKFLSDELADSLFELLSNTQLRTLSIPATFKFAESQARLFASLPFSLTHLDLFDVSGSYWDDGWILLRKLPRLTHLAVSGTNTRSMMEGALQELKNIRLIVIDAADNISTWYADDPRVVYCEYPEPVPCWLKGTVGGDDIWALGEKEQAKKIERLSSSRA